MGDSIEQWRARIGQWSGGRPQKCVISEHNIAQKPNHNGYGHIRFLVLLSLLVIGCVEINPGPKEVRYAIYSSKHLCICKGLWGKLYWLDGSRNDKY
jgi:hypothetical protein